MGDDTTEAALEESEQDLRPVARLLRRAAGDDEQLRHFLDTVGVRMVVRLATVTALGGSGTPSSLSPTRPLPGATHLTEQDLRILAAGYPDQSLAAHLLNGLFAGRRVGLRLAGDQAFTEDEWRIWFLAFTCHDYNKAWGIRAKPDQLDLGREAVRQLGEVLDFTGFWTEWLASLDDVMFVAQNAEKVAGSNLNLREYRFAQLTDHRRRDRLRQLASFADLLVHARSPSDVTLRASDGRPLSENLRETLRGVFGTGHAPRLAYHKLADVRGLVTNYIHNAVTAELETIGYEPFLFFPNGVVYLTPAETQAGVDATTVATKAWGAVVRRIADADSFGMTRGPTGIKDSSALLELVGWASMLRVAQRTTLGIGPGQSRAKTRLHGFVTGQSDNDLKRLYPDETERNRVVTESVASLAVPLDHRVDQLAEYLIFVFRSLADSGVSEADATALLLQKLGLNGAVSSAEAHREKGGTRFGWYYVAARFVKARAGLDEEQLREVLAEIGEAALPYLESKVQGADSGNLATVFTDYVIQHLEIDGRRVGQNAIAGFDDEFTRYAKAKAGKRPLCTLCAARYDAVEEEAAEVPFGPQAYSNRGRLDSRRLRRGICPICRIEYILRRVCQDQVREDKRPIQVFLYPTYFFTRETERLVQFFVRQLADLDIGKLRTHLAERGFVPEAVADFSGFLLTSGQRTLFLHPPSYETQHRSGLVFFSMTPGGQKPTDTASWILPALVALCTPYLLNVKAVVSASYVPVYESGSDFRETVILDGAPAFLSRSLGDDRFHLDAIPAALRRLLNLYDLHVEVFAQPRDFHWPLVNTITRDVTTDPYEVFSYYERRKRRLSKDGGSTAGAGGLSRRDVERFTRIYREFAGERSMGLVENLVDAYARFYRARGFSTHEVTRPLSMAIDTTVETLPATDTETLELMVAGPIDEMMDRVRQHQARGFDPICTDPQVGDYAHRLALSRQAIRDFTRLFIKDAFVEYCSADRAVLREQSNKLRSAAQFFYNARYGHSLHEAKETNDA